MSHVNSASDSEQDVQLVPPITSSLLRAFLARRDPVIDLDKLQDTTPFSEAGADSLDFFYIITEIQYATGLDIADQDIETVTTLAGLAAYLNARMT